MQWFFCVFFQKFLITFSHFKSHELLDLGGTWSTTYSCFFECMPCNVFFFQNLWIPCPLKEFTFKIMQNMFLDQFMLKSSVSAHSFTVSRKMTARGLYHTLSETDKALARGCVYVGMRSRETARRFRTGHQTINRILQLYRHSRQFKDLPRSCRPRVITRAGDRYVTTVVARNRFVAGPEVGI